MDGGEVFTQTFNCHVLCKRGKLQKEVQHAKKTRILEDSRKSRILREEEEGP